MPIDDGAAKGIDTPAFHATHRHHVAMAGKTEMPGFVVTGAAITRHPMPRHLGIEILDPVGAGLLEWHVPAGKADLFQFGGKEVECNSILRGDAWAADPLRRQLDRSAHP